jgi:uncharacterized protein YndB with AHSA1/START domain
MIRKTVVLPCGPDRAFALFTERAGHWWPAERRHTEDPSSTILMEASGRFFERASDGTEVDLGVVRRFEPASRLSLDWFPGTGRDNPTQVEVRFEAVAGGTRVTVEHGPGAAGAEAFERSAGGYARSWDLVLAALSRSA